MSPYRHPAAPPPAEPALPLAAEAEADAIWTAPGSGRTAEGDAAVEARAARVFRAFALLAAVTLAVRWALLAG